MSFSSDRIAAGFSLAEICREFRVSLATAREWDAGKAQPPPYVSGALDVLQRFGNETRPEHKADNPSDQSQLPSPSDDQQTPTRSSEQEKNLRRSSSSLIKSKRRVADHGEVFTPPWLVEKMLDLVKGETERIDARFLEPACGSGNFLVPILQRKLAAVEAKYGKSDFERRHYALLALTSVYGVELLADNIAECRTNMLEVFAGYLNLDSADELYRAASHVLTLNLIQGDAMTMKDAEGGPITVVEWAYVGKGKFNRRDFRLDVLTGMAAFHEERTLFAHLGKHEIFQPAESYPLMTVRDLAARDAEMVA